MKLIKRLIGFIKLYNDYEYEPEDWRHIVETYQQVLCNRTRTMSKPTYYLSDILVEIDKWYEYHDEYVCGREYVTYYGKCPMCTNCPDGCLLEK